MNKTALITGASSGIGKELAHIHAERGGNLVLIARRDYLLHALKEELELKYAIKATIICKDLTDSKSYKEIYDELKQAKIQIDYLINNAGFGGTGNFQERSLEVDQSMIQLNITALTSLSHFFLQDFVKRKEGKILNVSSTASLMPGPLQSVYFASKAYVTSFSNAIAQELKHKNVSVTNLMPGATKTDFGKISGMDKTSLFDKTADVRKVALDGYNAMMKGKLDVISGLTFSQKILTALIPFVPKSFTLSQMHFRQKEI